jgi:diaminohydroxyphosphoribosylaminopyrimidine deaminase/5-amino-6-(5-phosphoribosylamino)uracil reductase
MEEDWKFPKIREFFMDRHQKYMQHALDLAAKGCGFTSPNPAVGAVIVKDNQIIGSGFHRRFGAPHAEVLAIEEAGAAAKGAAMYVNLEPCNHFGKTPPCVDKIIAAGIATVYVGMIDPNPLVNGSGVRRLKEAGIEVYLGILEKEARQINRGFINQFLKQRPWITLKMAATADGFIADVSGKSQWITDTEARQYVGVQRSIHDAVMVGMGTVFKDDPSLLPVLRDGYIPYRVILDELLNIPQRMKLVSDEYKRRTVILTAQKNKDRKIEQLQRSGINILAVESDSFGWIKLSAALRSLLEFGITSIYCEGGGQLAGSLIQERLVDELQLFIAPKILGEGIKAFGGLMKSLDEAIQLEWQETQQLGADVLLKGVLK